jgi:hypothetical protein
MTPNLKSWRQRGWVSLWRYTEFKNKFGDWHITANDEGVDSLLELIELLRQSQTSEYRTISITAPTKKTLSVPNFQRGEALVASPDKWQIAVQPGSENIWSFPIALDSPSLLIGGSFVSQLVSGLEGIPRGEGDFAIGQGRDTRLCLWWTSGI